MPRCRACRGRPLLGRVPRRLRAGGLADLLFLACRSTRSSGFPGYNAANPAAGPATGYGANPGAYGLTGECASAVGDTGMCLPNVCVPLRVVPLSWGRLACGAHANAVPPVDAPAQAMRMQARRRLAPLRPLARLATACPVPRAPSRLRSRSAHWLWAPLLARVARAVPTRARLVRARALCSRLIECVRPP
jgi:hypothetical protein